MKAVLAASSNEQNDLRRLFLLSQGDGATQPEA
jgi:hypothetical protein